MGTTGAARPLTPKQVADRFGVTTTTVATWADSGKLRCFRTPGGQRRFRLEDVEQFIAAQGADTNAEGVA